MLEAGKANGLDISSTYVAGKQDRNEGDEEWIMEHFLTLSDKEHDELNHGGDDEWSNGPCHDGNDALKSLDADDAWSKDHDKLVGDAAKSPTLAL